MSNKTRQAESFFGATMPTTGPISTAPLSLGWWFTLDVDCWLMGFRAAQKAGDKNACVFQIWNDTPALVAMQAPSGKRVNIPLAADGWCQTWCRPRVRLDSATNYLVAYHTCSDVFTSIGAINHISLTNGHITILADDPTDPPNANGVYELPINFSIPLGTNSGNLYGVDILIETIP